MKLLILTALLIFVTGCAKQLREYVTTVRAPSYVEQPPTPIVTSQPAGFRISPGAVMSSGSQVSMKAALSSGQVSVTGANVKGRLGISRGPGQY